MERVILHCDMNNYFATVEEKYNVSLKQIPFAVCGDPEMRHSIVMSKNSIAKKAGVITGISYAQAREICPKLRYVKADYAKYLAETKRAREIYRKYSDTIIPYGMDEAWIDLSETGASIRDAQQIADLIRLEIMYTQGLSASVGVSDNYIFSKLGSDRSEPNAVTVISRENYQETVWPLPSSELLFVGKQTKKKLESVGIRTIGDIAGSRPEYLGKLLGKAGHSLWQFANGDDRNFHPADDTIKSIGNTITPPEDLHSNEEVSAIVYLLASSVSARLQKHRLKAFCIGVSMKDSGFNAMSRQCTLPRPTDDRNRIFNDAFALFTKHYSWSVPLRSVGVRAMNLLTDENEQLMLFEEEACEIHMEIGEHIKALTARFGKLHVEKSATTKDW